MIQKNDGFVLQLRLPVEAARYCKAMAQLHYGSLQAWSDDLLRRFCEQKPWATGLVEWKRPRSRAAPGSTGVNWRPVNFIISPATAELVQTTLDALRTERDESAHTFSEALFGYTAVVWYLTYINPPR